MQSHLDDDSPIQREMREQFMERLRGRAEKIHGEGRSTITGGRKGEKILAEWESEGVGVRQLPADEQGILRISIGGGEHTPVVVNYCVFRGDRAACIKLLKRALAALESFGQRGE